MPNGHPPAAPPPGPPAAPPPIPPGPPAPPAGPPAAPPAGGVPPPPGGAPPAAPPPGPAPIPAIGPLGHPAHGPHGGMIDEIRDLVRRRPLVATFLAGAILAGVAYGLYRTSEYLYERGRAASIEEETARIRQELFRELDQPPAPETPREHVTVTGKIRRYGDTLKVTVDPSRIDETGTLRQPFIDIERTREVGHGVLEGRAVLSVVAADGKIRRYDFDHLLRGDEEESEFSIAATLQE